MTGRPPAEGRSAGDATTGMERVLEQPAEETAFGFTWGTDGDRHYLVNGENDLKSVPEGVVRTLREHAGEVPIEELVSEVTAADESAGAELRELVERGFIREDRGVRRVESPPDVRLWPRAAVTLAVLGAGALASYGVLSSLPGGIEWLRYLAVRAPLLMGLMAVTIAVHEYGHYRAARPHVSPEVDLTVINGALPAVVTRTNLAYLLPANRRHWIDLAGPTAGGGFVLCLFGVGFLHPSALFLQVAAVYLYTTQLSPLIPFFHGDGYRLLTDVLSVPNLRSRGLRELRALQPSWASLYAAVSYGIPAVTAAGVFAYLVAAGRYRQLGVMAGLLGGTALVARLDLVERAVGLLRSCSSGLSGVVARLSP